MSPTAPPEFLHALGRYDPELRVRWAVRSEIWFLERLLPPRHRQLLAERPNPWRSAKGLDRYDGWREGYVHVMSIHPSLLHWSIVAEELTRADAHLQGGMEALNRALDEEAERIERAKDRHEANWLEASSKEAYDRLAWLLGNRFAMPHDPHGIESADRIEHHDGFTVRLRRRVHQETA